ncbi:MAG: DUF58 domain-containing protein [Chloroflexota bacterium]
MTKLGLGFIAASGLIYLVANQSQIGWLYLLDAILWSLLVVSAILPWWSLKLLKVEQLVSWQPLTLNQPSLNGPVEDDAIELKLKVTNNGRLPRHFIKVQGEFPFAFLPEQRRAFLLPYLRAKSTVVCSCPVTCYRRGFYPSVQITLQSGGWLGLVVRRRTFRIPLKLTVYPAYHLMKGIPAGETAWNDWGQAAKSNAAAEFYGSREYRYGDPLKYIHWRNTARAGHFMLKEFEQAGGTSLTVAFETKNDFGMGRETTLEYSVRIAASLAKLCADAGRTMNLIAGETVLRYAGWPEIMGYLARVEAGTATRWNELAPVQPGMTVVIVPAVKDALATVLSRLAGAHDHVVVYLDGFAPDAPVATSPTPISNSNVRSIRCSPGNLEKTIEELSSALLTSSVSPSSGRNADY